MRLLQFRPDGAESLSKPGDLLEEVSPKLDDLDPPVEAGLDDVLQHLVLAALTVDVEQVKVFNSSSHIIQYSSSVNDLQRNLLSFILIIFHPEGSLSFQVSLGQENGSGAVAQAVVMKGHVPLVSVNVLAPHFLQFFIKSRNWLVNVELTEMLLCYGGLQIIVGVLYH